jgi:pimeloyl-ACP methyl ester carboxylesterase
MAILMTIFVFIILTIIITILIILSFRNPININEKKPKEFGIPCKEIYINTKNNKKLYGWWIKNRDSFPIIILVHGWGRNTGKMLPYLTNLYPKGYNILVFDSRNHGKSDPDQYSSMLKFAEDIKASIDFLESTDKLKHGLTVIGLSIGGSAAIYASSHDTRIDNVISVGAFATPEDIMLKQLKRYHIPYYPFVWLFFKLVEQKIGVPFKKLAPVNNISASNARYLIIHGEKDEVVPPVHAIQLSKAGKKENITLFLIKNKGHSNCHFENGFWELIDKWIQKKPTTAGFL